MSDDGKAARVRFALALMEGRVHKAVGDKRCGCGKCAHWVAVAAERAGLRREDLVAVLPPAAKPQRGRPRAPRTLQVRICDSGTIRVRGRDVDPQEGLAILLERLHRRE
jgi:hypothetical protein